jgi:hypothetical protein
MLLYEDMELPALLMLLLLLEDDDEDENERVDVPGLPRWRD